MHPRTADIVIIRVSEELDFSEIHWWISLNFSQVCVAVCSGRFDVGQTMINHPFGNDLYNLCLVIWGMVYYCLSTLLHLQPRPPVFFKALISHRWATGGAAVATHIGRPRRLAVYGGWCLTGVSCITSRGFEQIRGYLLQVVCVSVCGLNYRLHKILWSRRRGNETTC